MPKVSIIVPLYNAEKRLDVSLDSIQRQTHKDIEVILVDDGSKDRSVEIAKEWCNKDKRFKLIENGINMGVSTARNNGLDMATGEYIRFVDGDDTIPAESTAQMLDTASKHNSDLVIGIMRREMGASSFRFLRTEKLAMCEKISKYDENLNYSFSVCNKMFRRELIEREGIRFEPYKLAEDGLFLFSFVNKCNEINGCNTEVYNYYKNEVFEDTSSSDVYTTEMMKGILEISDKIQYMNYYAPAEFFDNFMKRILEVTLVHECYRKLWSLDEETEELLRNSFDKYWSRLPRKMKRELRRAHKDLKLKDRLLTKQEIAEEPVIAFVLSNKLSEEALSTILPSIYGQKNPIFVLYVQKSKEAEIPKEYAERENIIKLDIEDSAEFFNEVLWQTNSLYISFIEDEIAFSKDAVMNACKSFNKKCDYISFLTEFAENGASYKENVFEMLSNKLFSVDSLKENSIIFSNDRGADFKALASKLRLKNQENATVYYRGPESREQILSRDTLPIKEITFAEGSAEAVPNNTNGFPGRLLHAKSNLYANKSFRTRFYRAVAKILRLFVPLDEKAIFFISDIRAEMSGSMKYVYEKIPKEYKTYTYFSATKWELKSLFKYIALIYKMNRCKYILLEDFFVPTEYMRLRSGQEICQLWHAAGAYKRFAYGRSKSGEKLNIHPGYRKYAKAIVSSPEIRPIYAKSYGIALNKVEATGIPRTDLFFDSEHKEKRENAFYAKYPELREKKIVLIAPTYRGTTLDKAGYDFDMLDFEGMKQELGEDYAIITAWHPAVYNSFAAGTVQKPDYDSLGGFVMDIPEGFSTDDMMLIADVMITDYSSVIFDYSLLNKPIIFYTYDMDDYAGDRGLYYNFEEYVYGQLVTEKKDLIDAIKKASFDAVATEKFRNRFMKSCDGNSAKKTVDYLLGDIKPSELGKEYFYTVIYYGDAAEKEYDSIESLVAQTFDKSKIQLISAGLDVQPTAASKFGDFKMIERESDESLSHILNRCLDEIKGEVLVLLRAGDEWDKEAFSKAYKCISQNKNSSYVFACNSEVAKSEGNAAKPGFIKAKESGLINLRRNPTMVNQLDGNYMIRTSGICDRRFNESLTAGFVNMFYHDVVTQTLRVFYIKDSKFKSHMSGYFDGRKKISENTQVFCDYVKSCYLHMIDNDFALYGGITRYTQIAIIKDILSGLSDKSDNNNSSEVYEEVMYELKQVTSFLENYARDYLKSQNTNVSRYMNWLHKYNDELNIKDFVNKIEDVDFRILHIKEIGKELHIEGSFTSVQIADQRPSELLVMDGRGSEYRPILTPRNRLDVRDCMGTKIASSYLFALDLPVAMGAEYRFCSKTEEGIRSIALKYSENAGFRKYIDESRVRDTRTVIRRETDKLLISEPSEQMQKVLQREKAEADRPLDDVISFVTIRRSRFEDNMKLVYDELKADNPTRTFAAQRPFEMLQEEELRDVVYRSNVVVTDDYLWLYRQKEKPRNQKLVQLWHACGAFKKFGIDGSDMIPAVDAMTHQYYDMVVASSEHVKDIYAKAFGISKDKVKALGVPRTDIFFDDKKKRKLRAKVYEKHPELKEKSIILYAPTFRDTGTKGSRTTFKPDLDFDRLSSNLKKDQIFVISPHPVMTDEIVPGEYDNIREIRDVSSLDMMMVADVLITDYSSVIFEFSLLRKPMAFFCYDYNIYDRDFYLDYEKDLPGPILYEQNDLEDYLRKGEWEAASYESFIEKYMGACDGNSTRRVAEEIAKMSRL